MKKSDPRVLRTEYHIKQCFFELLKKKPADEISVKELCEMAHCSRNTFYTHFEYKDNLYRQIVEELILDCLQGFYALTCRISEQTDETIDQYIENFMNGFSQNADKLRIILVSDRNGYFRAKLQEKTLDAMLQTSSQSSGLNTDTAEWKLILRYSSAGIIEFVSFWLQTPEISLARAKQILRDLMDSSMHMGEKYLQDRDTQC